MTNHLKAQKQRAPGLMVAICASGHGLISCVCFADSKGRATK